ncbi:hypothetical protein V6N12_063448 [Hibiscus sabdariffa]|uniref:Protein kinase domain-containing protein n=1 Tax=Hibiscus sabdariffa TaxID=183260 RepID=A0ABR2FBX2_9ROSI
MKILFILTSRGKKHPTRELTFGSVILASISGVNSATAQQQHQMLPLQKSHRFGKAAASQNKLPTSSFPLRSNHDDSARFVSIGVQGLSGMVHGNACLESVVMETLDRKLHAFDVLSEYDGAKWNCYRTIVANSQSSSSIGNGCGLKAPPWAIDSWGLGCLIYEIFSGMKLGETEELWDTSSIPKPLLPDYQRLLSSLPSRRLNTSKLIDNSEFFQIKLEDTIHFMEILSLKDSVERDTFFRKLPTLAEQLHCQIVLNKIFPLLTSALEYGSAAAHALNALLKTGSWLSVEEFYLKVLPTIVKLFASSDRAIRVALLQHIVQYGEPLSAQVVDDQVYPHVATGFSDTSAFLRELTLKSLLLLAPKLSKRNLSGSLLKYLSKLQVEEPAIRTNTTILLGNIASYLNSSMTLQMGHDLLNSSKGKSLDQAPVAAANSARPVTATTSAASSGISRNHATSKNLYLILSVTKLNVVCSGQDWLLVQKQMAG